MLCSFHTSHCIHSTRPTVFISHASLYSFHTSHCVHYTLATVFISHFPLCSFHISHRVHSTLPTVFISHLPLCSFHTSHCVHSTPHTVFIPHLPTYSFRKQFQFSSYCQRHKSFLINSFNNKSCLYTCVLIGRYYNKTFAEKHKSAYVHLWLMNGLYFSEWETPQS